MSRAPTIKKHLILLGGYLQLCQQLDYGYADQSGGMTDELKRISERNGSGLVDALSRNFQGGTEEYQKTLVRIAGVPTKLRTEHLPNTHQILWFHISFIILITVTNEDLTRWSRVVLY
jgi:hypothetical protein